MASCSIAPNPGPLVQAPTRFLGPNYRPVIGFVRLSHGM